MIAGGLAGLGRVDHTGGKKRSRTGRTAAPDARRRSRTGPAGHPIAHPAAAAAAANTTTTRARRKPGPTTEGAATGARVADEGDADLAEACGGRGRAGQAAADPAWSASRRAEAQRPAEEGREQGGSPRPACRRWRALAA